MAMVASSSVLVTYNQVDKKITEAAQIFAEQISSQVSEAILSTYLYKEQYPNGHYSKIIDLPLRFAEQRDYYIEVTNRYVYVNTTDGRVQEKSTIYNVTKNLAVEIDSRRVHGSEGDINISCQPFNYEYKIDFGTENSSASSGYLKISNKTFDDFSDYGFNYMIPIYINNPTETDINYNYQLLIQLNDSNFDYNLAKKGGSDIRFYNDPDSAEPTNNLLDYWIETWYSAYHTSRIWVELKNLPKEGKTIYMYFGKDTLGPISNGKNTFPIFNDFKNPIDNDWVPKIPSLQSRYGVNLNQEKLYLSHGASLMYNSPLDHSSNNYAIEAKVKSVSDNNTEACIFIDGNDALEPYKNGFIFSSSSNKSYNHNLTLIKNTGSTYNNLSSGYQPPMKKDQWYRLSYINNGVDNIITRYYYENFSVDGYGSHSTSPSPGSGYFGLCTINHSDATAYYDWIYVRNYTANISEDVTSLKEAVPTASLGGLQSKNYIFWLSEDVKSNINGRNRLFNDYIYGSAPARFKIMNLDLSEDYSLTVDVGDGNTNINNMKITIYNATSAPIYSIENINTNYHEKYLFNNIESNEGINKHEGSISIEFSDRDNVNKYWAVNSLTLQKGNRAIVIGGS